MMKKGLFYILILMTGMVCQPIKMPGDIDARGDLATIRLKDSQLSGVELLSLNDSALFILKNQRILIIRTSRIDDINVIGYNVDQVTRLAAAVPSLILQGIIFGAAAHVGASGWKIISGLSMVGTTALYLGSGTDTDFSTPFDREETERIRLFCRYPQGLSARQWSKLLTYYGQTTFGEFTTNCP